MLLEVGKRVPSPFCDIVIRDGALFKFAEDGSTYLPIYFFDMSNEEAQEIRAGKIRTAYLAEPPFWLGFIRIGSIICELEVDPMLELNAGHSFSAEFFRENALVTILGIDSKGMVLKAGRAVTYPSKFLSSLYLTFSRFTPSGDYSRQYQAYLAHLRRFDEKTLWQRAEQSGFFGSGTKLS